MSGQHITCAVGCLQPGAGNRLDHSTSATKSDETGQNTALYSRILSLYGFVGRPRHGRTPGCWLLAAKVVGDGAPAANVGGPVW